MKNSYTLIHYNEKLRPYTKYPPMLCKHIADKYFKAHSGKLLDVCCGRGEHMAIFKNMGFDTYGVDRESMAKEKNINVKIVDVDLQNLPFEDNFFDFVIVKAAIEHIRDVYHFMDNLYRVLKPGGKIVITTPDWKVSYNIFYDDADHKSPFTVYSLHDLLVRYYFKNVHVQNFYHLPYTWKGNFYHVFPRMIAFLIPIDFSPSAKLNFFIKIIKFSREREILAYGEK